MAKRTGQDFGISGLIMGITGLFVPAKIPYVDIGNLGLILAFFAIILGVIAIVKSEKGLGYVAIALGAIPFIQIIINAVIGAFGPLDWIISIALIILAVAIVVYLLFIKK